jgi:hypothetical protein
MKWAAVGTILGNGAKCVSLTHSRKSAASMQPVIAKMKYIKATFIVVGLI